MRQSASTPPSGSDGKPDPKMLAGIKQLERQDEAWAALGPQAHVVRMDKAHHYIFRSN